MFSRRPDVRHNRGRVAQSAVAAGGAPADLLSVAQSVGVTLLFDLYTPATVALSGSDITSLTNRITDTAVASAGTPQYNATGLGGGPAVMLDGSDDRFTGTESAVFSLFSDNTPFTLIYAAQWTNADANRNIFSAGRAASSTGFRRFGQADSGNGRHTATFSANGGTDSAAIISAADLVAATPRIVEWDFDGSDLAMRLNGTPQTLGTTAFATAGSITPDKYTFGCLGRDNNSLFHAGPASLIIAAPRLVGDDLDALYAAMASHHAVLAGLLA